MTIRMTTLENGLRIITDEIPHVETVSCGAWFGVGSRFEQKKLNGVSHFLEHMAFKGTAKRNALQIAEEAESVGAYLNAYTSREMTAYYARCLQKDMPLMIDIIGDILQNSLFDHVEFEREKKVILQEIGQTNDTPDDVVFDYFQETCFKDQPLGRSILGTEETVTNLTPDQIKDYMKNHYGYQNMVFSAAGHLRHDDVVEQVMQHFQNLNPAPLMEMSSANYTKGTWIQKKDLEQAHLVYGFEGVPFQHPDFYPLMIYSTLMGGGMSSRLFQEIREKRGLVYSIYSGHSSYRDTGLFYIYAGTGENDVQELLPTLHGELQNSLKGFSEDEIRRAKNQLKAGLMMSLASTSHRCERLAKQILIYGRFYEGSEICAEIDRVTADDLKKVTNDCLAKPATFISYGNCSAVDDWI